VAAWTRSRGLHSGWAEDLRWVFLGGFCSV
jgi:hypothetical protein